MVDRIRETAGNVLGGTGEAGTNDVDQLADQGHSVLGDLTSQGEGLLNNLPQGAQDQISNQLGGIGGAGGEATGEGGGLAEKAGDLLRKVTGS
ncbi:MAG: hypothetical protein AVDCRST_MAG49-2529 [uncultured Thermomicrobiales bacterium]|uniref:Uncharacterized protein n=1 Tax=uncultured Thermomicrobiales bacterium TaxID=1645740 RepID=A0A6J4UXB6_9BACT|nr:MAG: hypothetical protein AVDCRST_MAG49-2529 [uncultured Thermomicrobiales bacterium]